MDPRSLPPSSNAAKLHSLRVFFTIQEGLGNFLDPTEYGYYVRDNRIEPITSSDPVAPLELLKTIVCNCNKSRCSGGKCTCKSYGLNCTEFCGCNDKCENLDRDKTIDENEEDHMNDL